ncbi:MAG: RnfABCDGE type electron transport complex subunit G [Ruminococcus sp.]|nr:RnfABCDGE type electron transport complex subunit G [Ruminococcus sp.]
MRKINFKAVFIPTISLFIICLLMTAALAVTNSITSGKIAKNEAQTQQESMTVVCPEAVSFEEVSETVFKGLDNEGGVVGYAISTVANGYGGQVKVMTGIDVNGEIINIDVYYNDDETPGLGKNTSNESFTSQFSGLLASETIVVDKDYSGEGKKVDAVTSSTISSRAVVAAVNEATEIYNKEIAGGEQ